MILHLSTQQSGGAAIAALRLHKALIKAGTNSQFISALGSTNPHQCVDVLPKPYERYWQRGLHKFGISCTEHRKWQKTRLQENLPDTVLSGIRSDNFLSNYHLVKTAEIIHLHWVTGMFDWPDFFANVRQPIVWTLHDMNPFMGVFHYEGDREKGSSNSQLFEKKLEQQKAELLKGRSRIVCVAPSRWLSEKARASEVLGHCDHRVIRNAIDTQVFRPFPVEFGREIFGLPMTKKILLVVAERLDDYRKGMDMLLSSLKKCELNEEWEMVALGRSMMVTDKAALKVRALGQIDDERLLALLYSAADLLVVPSREDNLPNTILESLCCGTPVVGMPAGGVPEAIKAPRDGILAAEITSGALADALTKASFERFDRAEIRKCAVERFDSQLIAKDYHVLYENFDLRGS